MDVREELSILIRTRQPLISFVTGECHYPVAADVEGLQVNQARVAPIRNGAGTGVDAFLSQLGANLLALLDVEVAGKAGVNDVLPRVPVVFEVRLQGRGPARFPLQGIRSSFGGSSSELATTNPSAPSAATK